MLFRSEFVRSKGETLIQNARIVLCQNEIPIDATHEALRLAKKHSAVSVFNVAPGSDKIPKEMLQLCDILCVNETEVVEHYSLPTIATTCYDICYGCCLFLHLG